MPADRALKSLDSYGWSAGFRNMLRKENARWWNPKSLVIQFVIWLVIINGTVAFYLFVIPPMFQTAAAVLQANNTTSEQARQIAASGLVNMTKEKIVNMGLQDLFGLAGLAALLGAIIMTHDSLLKERESGTAAWIMSKPMSRKAFVLSKILANSFGMVTIVILVQGIVAYAQCSIVLGSPLAVIPFLAALGVMALNVLFYMVMAISLGAFSLSRGVALGVPIIFSLMGDLVLALKPELSHFMPWTLGDIAFSISNGSSMASIDVLPIIATAIFILLFVAAAIVRFEQIEL